MPEKSKNYVQPGICGLDRSRCSCHEYTHARSPAKDLAVRCCPRGREPGRDEVPDAEERTVLTHIFGGTTYTCGLIWLIGFAINDHDRFQYRLKPWLRPKAGARPGTAAS